LKVLVYSTRPYDEESLNSANQGKHQLHFTEARLDKRTVTLARDYPAVCCFVDDALSAAVLTQLSQGGTKLIALRSTGFNNVDLPAAEKHGITVMRVTRYSPYAVAEFAVCMMLALNRKIHRAYERVREGNFLLHGLLGFDLHGKVVGIIGTGKIGVVLGTRYHGESRLLVPWNAIRYPRGPTEPVRHREPACSPNWANAPYDQRQDFSAYETGSHAY
jgi:D-lactate dehydrogenase